MCPMLENQSSFATLYPPFLIFFSTVNKLPRPASLPPDKVVRQKKCTLMSLPVIWGDRLPKNSSLIVRCQSEMSTTPVRSVVSWRHTVRYILAAVGYEQHLHSAAVQAGLSPSQPKICHGRSGTNEAFMSCRRSHRQTVRRSDVETKTFSPAVQVKMQHLIKLRGKSNL